MRVMAALDSGDRSGSAAISVSRAFAVAMAASVLDAEVGGLEACAEERGRRDGIGVGQRDVELLGAHEHRRGVVGHRRDGVGPVQRDLYPHQAQDR